MNILPYLLLTFFMPGIWDSGIKSAAPFAIDKGSIVDIDKHLQGIWKMAEDTDVHNYFIIENDSEFNYSITYMNRSGNNRGLEHGRFYFSEIKGVKFINIANWDEEHPGFVLLKVNEITKGSWNMTANLVTDMSITKVTSREELRKLLEKNLNNPAFYGKELHFRKRFEFNSFRP